MRFRFLFLAVAAIAIGLSVMGVNSTLSQAPVAAIKPAGSGADEKHYPMIVEVEINRPENVRGWHRPYVAVWLQNKEDLPVRTIALWVQTEDSGRRWHSNLKKWFRDDHERKRSDSLDLVDSISGATRAAGSYKVAWDGLDDHGKPLAPGKYTLLVEAVREHGSYQIIKEPMELGPEAFKKELTGNLEIHSVKLDYRGMKAK